MESFISFIEGKSFICEIANLDAELGIQRIYTLKSDQAYFPLGV